MIAGPHNGTNGTPADNRLSVLHILEATLGGTLRYMEDISKSLSPSDYRLGFAYGDSRADSRLKPFLFDIEAQGWSTFDVPMIRKVSVLSELRSLSVLIRVLHQFRPDIVHCHSSKAGLVGRLAAKMTRPAPQVVYSPHALASPLGRRYLYVEQALKSLTERYVAVSDSEAAQFVQSGLSSEARVSIVYPIIDCGRYSSTQNKPKPGYTVLGVGRLTQQKDPLTFVSIVNKLRRQLPEVNGVWVGDGELKGAFCEAVAQSQFPEAIQLVPWQHDIWPYFAGADVLLSTSLYESFGYMVAEALSMRVPVVATAVTGTCDILTGRFAANMYAVGDEEAALNLLRKVLLEPDTAEEWATAAQHMVSTRFTRQAMQEGLRRAYHAVKDPSAFSIPRLQEVP